MELLFLVVKVAVGTAIGTSLGLYLGLKSWDRDLKKRTKNEI